MKTFECPDCKTIRETEDDIIHAFCPVCLKPMQDKNKDGEEKCMMQQ